MRTSAKVILAALAWGSLIFSTTAVAPAQADVNVSFAYASRPADIRVWLGYGSGYEDDYEDDYYEDQGYDDQEYDDQEYEVYPSATDVVLHVRASRSCYATVYVVDTEGFIHVVYPLSPGHEAYLRGGRVYRFRLGDFGFADPYFGRGIAYAYAVSSPVPFDYSYYGAGVFGAGFGFQIFGDPYVACREFYVRILPPACNVTYLRISHARFYVREYARYPRYLCVGWHDHHGVRQYCGGTCDAYRHYRIHAAEPYRILRPDVRVRDDIREYTRIAKASKKPRIIATPEHGVIHDQAREKAPVPKVRELRSANKPIAGSKGVVKTKPVIGGRESVRRGGQAEVRKTVPSSRKAPVVRSSHESFVKAKRDITEMRRELKQPKRAELKQPVLARKDASKGAKKEQPASRGKTRATGSTKGSAKVVKQAKK